MEDQSQGFHGVKCLPDTEFGVKCFEITEEQYLNPAWMFEKMSTDLDIQMTGVFIGRLPDSDERREADVASVQTIKSLLRTDPKDKELNRKIFSPEVLTIGDLWRERNVLSITGISQTRKMTKEYSKLKKQFKEKILEHNFFESPTTELEQILETEGVDSALNALFPILRDRERKILYAPGMVCEEYLRTSSTCSMRDMKTNLEDLHGGPHLGITTPGVYVGSEGATFCLHIEDCSFESVNRHVAGKAKVWFVVAPRYSQALYDLIRDLGIPKEDRSCAVFLQHKHVFVDPRTLLREGIPVTTVIQRPGDVVYVLPDCHHQGFNVGFNLNEAINCASKAFALHGMISAPRCHCPIVAGLHYSFELDGVLEKLGVDGDLIAHYREDRIKILSDLLQKNTHPKSGKPFSKPVLPQQLLGPLFKDMEILKPYLISVEQSKTSRDDFWGGCLLVDLVDSDNEQEETEEVTVEEVEMDGRYGDEDQEAEKDENQDEDEMEVEEEEDEDDEEGEKIFYPGKKVGKIQCSAPSCSWQTADGGKKGMKRLENHVTKNHKGISETLWPILQKKFDMDHRKYKTTSEFICNLCGKTRRGNAAHERRHKEVCKGKKGRKGKN